MLRAGKIKEWAYLVLQWNMMARKCNIADIHFNFIRWSGDMMILHILNNHKKEIKNMIYSTQLNNSFGPLPLDQEGGESVEDLQNRRSAECFQSIMWQHSKKRKAPDEFSLLGQDSTITEVSNCIISETPI